MSYKVEPHCYVGTVDLPFGAAVYSGTEAFCFFQGVLSGMGIEFCCDPDAVHRVHQAFRSACDPESGVERTEFFNVSGCRVALRFSFPD